MTPRPVTRLSDYKARREMEIAACKLAHPSCRLTAAPDGIYATGHSPSPSSSLTSPSLTNPYKRTALAEGVGLIAAVTAAIIVKALFREK